MGSHGGCERRSGVLVKIPKNKTKKNQGGGEVRSGGGGGGGCAGWM